jgi:hypothetical protein
MTRRVKTFVEKQIKWSLTQSGYPIRKALSPEIIVTPPIHHRAIIPNSCAIAIFSIFGTFFYGDLKKVHSFSFLQILKNF